MQTTPSFSEIAGPSETPFGTSLRGSEIHPCIPHSRTVKSLDVISLSPGTRLGPYEILSSLGAGGMGEVYRAKDARLDRAVALKVLPEDFFEDKDRVARFEREAKLLAALNHPNIAAIYSFEEIPGVPGFSGRHVLVQELLEGETLRSAVSG